MRYIDIHSHLNLPEFKDDRDDVIARLRAKEIATIIVGVDRETSLASVAIAETNDNLFACIGQHPTDNATETFDADFYAEQAKHPKVVAVGECGLDYFRLKGNTTEEKDRQRELFFKQIVTAYDADLPLMIHARPTRGSMDAYEDVLSILQERKASGTPARGNVHFFVGDQLIAERFRALGFTMSFTGVITFASDYDEIIRMLPLESIMSETDAPFVAPVPYRGERCEPEYVALIAARIAEIRGEDSEMVRGALIANAKRIFGI